MTRLPSHAAPPSPEDLLSSGSTLTPRPGAKARVWQQIEARMAEAQHAPVAVSLLRRVRDFLTPSAELQSLIRARVLLRLQPAPAYAFRMPRVARWAAAFCITLLAFRAGLPLFLAPGTIAQSQVLLLPTQGQPTFLRNGLWEPIAQQTPLEKSAFLKTDADGALTVVVHDDFVLRLAANTTVALHDLSDRPQQGSGPTLTVYGGRVWVLGLLPGSVRPVSVQTPEGTVLVHDGSVSIETGKEGEMTVRVWNRRAEVQNDDLSVPLIAGERVDLQAGRVTFLKKIAPALYDEAWVAQNLAEDAAHQREIAHLQQERRAAAAGILPGTTFYPVKRFAEEVDVLLSLSSAERVEKRLQQAATRFNEAAALINDNKPDATVALQEYKDTILSLAGSGGSAVVQSLVQEQVASTTAEVAAALPTDPGYALKQAVLQTSASLPETTVNKADVESTLVLDTLEDFRQRIEQRGADLSVVRQDFLAYHLDLSSLSPDARQEAVASYALLSQTLGTPPLEDDASSSSSSSAVADGGAEHLTPAEIRALAIQMRDDIFNHYDTPRGRYNEMLRLMETIKNHPDRGSILRQLHQVLNQPELEEIVAREMTKIRSEMEYHGDSGQSL